MTRIVPMRPEHFAAFAEREIAAYAHENVAAFRWQEATAGERARAEFVKLLPHGLATQGQYLYEILDGPKGETVGQLWFEVGGTAADRSAYLRASHRAAVPRPAARAGRDAAAGGMLPGTGRALACTCSRTTPRRRRCTARWGSR